MLKKLKMILFSWFVIHLCPFKQLQLPVYSKKLKNVPSLENTLILGIYLGKIDLEISLDQLIK